METGNFSTISPFGENGMLVFPLRLNVFAGDNPMLRQHPMTGEIIAFTTGIAPGMVLVVAGTVAITLGNLDI
jgi:hypothetical protein